MRKSSKKTFLLFVEGSTEAVYFESLRQLTEFRNSDYKLVVENCEELNNLLQLTLNPTARQKKKIDSASEVGFIFDKDHLGFNDFQKLLSKYKRLGFSNPKFELWLLAHFEPLKEQYGDVIKSLENYLKNYEKAEYRIADLAKSYETAISNSEKFNSLKFDEVSTSVALVILAILGRKI